MSLRVWLEERTGAAAALRKILDHPIAGGARWAYVFGSALAILVLVQIVTGLTLATYYSPSSREAWGSVHFISHELSLGWFVRGMHHWAASAMTVLLLLHMGQVFVYAAYRKPREFGWWSGLALLGLTLAFSLTGYLLPWDQKGYWASRVVTSLIGAIPGIGTWLKHVLHGGNDFGTLTLTRFFTLHAMVLPATLAAVLVFHVALFRRNGVSTHPSRPSSDTARTEPFWPRQLAYDALFSAGVVGIVAAITLYTHGAPLSAPADPASNYPARPEWYFLWLFQILKFVPGAREGVGVMGFATVAFALLVMVPYLDRGRNQSRSLPLVFAALAVAAISGLTVWAKVQDVGDASLVAQKREAEAAARRSFVLARLGIPPGGPSDLYLNDPREAGRRSFVEMCQGCHQRDGIGGETAPDLTGYMSFRWVRGLIADPTQPAYYGRTKVAGMNPTDASPGELDQLAHYVLSLGGHASAGENAADLFEDSGCQNCHARAGQEPKRGPSLVGYGSRAWIRGAILHPEASEYFGADNQMPSFEGRLSDAQIDDLLTYLLSEGVSQ